MLTRMSMLWWLLQFYLYFCKGELKKWFYRSTMIPNIFQPETWIKHILFGLIRYATYSTVCVGSFLSAESKSSVFGKFWNTFTVFGPFSAGACSRKEWSFIAWLNSILIMSWKSKKHIYKIITLQSNNGTLQPVHKSIILTVCLYSQWNSVLFCNKSLGGIAWC